METFKNLDIEKQEQIINAAMYVFAKNGYRKAYMSEIATRAEVSKPTLFYHFGTKIDLYFFLLDTAFDEITESVDIDEIYHTNDFFECLRVSTEHKMRALRKRPSLMKFLTKFYFELEPEVEARKQAYLQRSAKIRDKLVFEDLDVSKFKSTVDPKLVMDMLLKWTEGYMAQADKVPTEMDDNQISQFYEQMITEFLEMIEMLRINFYQPQYLNMEEK